MLVGGTAEVQMRDPCTLTYKPSYAHRLTIWPTATNFGTIAHVRRGRVSRGSCTIPILKGLVPSRDSPAPTNFGDLHTSVRYDTQQPNLAWWSNYIREKNLPYRIDDANNFCDILYMPTRDLFAVANLQCIDISAAVHGADSWRSRCWCGVAFIWHMTTFAVVAGALATCKWQRTSWNLTATQLCVTCTRYQVRRGVSDFV